MSNDEKHRARLINAVLERVDVDALVDQVELDELLDRIDVNRLLDRVDLTRLLDRVDVDRLLDHVDVNRLIDRVDVQAVTQRANVGELVAQSTSQVAGSTLDVARGQAVGVDTLIMGFADRLLGRDGAEQPLGPPALVPQETEAPAVLGAPRVKVSGYYAGPLTRLLAYLIDSFVVFTGAGLISAAIVGSVNIVLGAELEWDWRAGVLGVAAFAIWSFLYLWVGIAISGQTPGMGVVGIKVVGKEGRPVSPRHAAVRALVLPFSVVTVVGVLGVVFDAKQRALHDLAAKTAVVYDWGDRPAELPTPLSRWLTDHGVSDVARSP